MDKIKSKLLKETHTHMWPKYETEITHTASKITFTSGRKDKRRKRRNERQADFNSISNTLGGVFCFFKTSEAVLSLYRFQVLT